MTSAIRVFHRLRHRPRANFRRLRPLTAAGRKRIAALRAATLHDLAAAVLPRPVKVRLRATQQAFAIVRLAMTGENGMDRGYALNILRNLGGHHARHCPVCGHVGRFAPFGIPPRIDALCPSCGALERHRLLAHVDRKAHIFRDADALLHIAPEPVIAGVLRHHCSHYVSADLMDPAADLRLDIEDMDVPSAAFDTVLCSHVLEHVDDRKALGEIHRVLKPDGRLVAMIPVAEGCAATYEDPDIQDAAHRALHFGQGDHLRLYGADIRERLGEAGFSVHEYTAEGAEAVRHGLMMGEKVFVCDKT